MTQFKGMNREKIKLGISSCLLGEKVRYDGGHKLDHFLTDTLGAYVDWVPVCPEVESGLSVPREAMHLVGDPGAPRLVTIRSGVGPYQPHAPLGAQKDDGPRGRGPLRFRVQEQVAQLGHARRQDLLAGRHAGQHGSGIFAKAFQDRFPLLPVEDEGRLHDPALRENFIERIFVYKRWQEFRSSDKSVGGLVSFHTSHKLLIMAHSPRHYSALGKLVADPRKYRREELFERYLTTLMEGLQFLATVKKNTNVLQHMAGYFKQLLSTDEKQELQNVIENYHQGLVPLIVPMTLLQHYVRKYSERYLKQQIYLNPHPLELMLRNHV